MSGLSAQSVAFFYEYFNGVMHRVSAVISSMRITPILQGIL